MRCSAAKSPFTIVTFCLCALFLILPCRGQNCFPSGSGFALKSCKCDPLGDGQYHLDCLSNEELNEFPVLEDTYPGVVLIRAPSQRFTELRKEHLDPFPNLKEIDFSSGELRTIASDTFKNTKNLETLDLSHNRLTQFPPVSGLTNLKRIRVQSNNILSLEPGDLDGCYYIATLNAYGNNIRRLRKNVFKDQCNMVELDLNENSRLSSIEDDVFEVTPLRKLGLRNTKIDHLPSKGLRPFLLELDLSNTRNLKRFNAYESGKEFNNQTYPLLEKVSFFYHAHCCQMQNHYFVSEAVQKRQLLIQQVLKKTNHVSVESSIDFVHDYKREASDNILESYVCVNASKNGDDNILLSNENVTDPLLQTIDEFCTSVYCNERLCGQNCLASISGFPSGDSDSSEIVCVKIAPSSCLDQHYSTEKFTSVITFESVTCVTSTPTPTPKLICYDGCDTGVSEDYCRCMHSDYYDICDTCAGEGCEDWELDPSTYEHCAEEDYFPELGRCCDDDTAAMCCEEEEVPVEVKVNCTGDVINVVCRKRFNSTASSQSVVMPTSTPNSEPIPTLFPSTTDECGLVVDALSEHLLPDGWFYPPGSEDIVCMECESGCGLVSTVTSVTSVTPTMTQTPTVCVRLPFITEPPIPRLKTGGLTACSPQPDNFNPCEDLLGESDYLRAAIWFVIIFGLFGNGMVLLVFTAYSVIIRRMKIKFFSMHFLYANLAGADLLMSVYLLSIASVDLNTNGHFSEEDIEWRTGPGCGFTGFCAIISTVVSVYTLVVITTERVYTITFVFKNPKAFTKKKAAIVMVLGWTLGIIMAMLPIVGVNSYELVAICLPFDTQSPLALGYISFLLLVTGIAFVYIAICYAIIFYQAVLSPHKRDIVVSGNMDQRKADLKMTVRMFLLVFTNFVCWFPIALVSLSAAFGTPLHGISVKTAKIFVVFVFPLNSCMNPFLYTLSTKSFRNNFLALLAKCGLFRRKVYSIAVSSVVPSDRSKNTSVTSVSRRSSVASRMWLFYRRGSTSQSDISFDTRRPSQFSMASTDDSSIGGFPTGRRSSAFSQTSSEENYFINDSAAKEKKTLTNASSLDVVPEVDEVMPTPQPSLRVNEGYLDYDEKENECNHQEPMIGKDNLILADQSATIIENGLPDALFSSHHVVANVLQIHEEPSDTLSVTTDFPLQDINTNAYNP